MEMNNRVTLRKVSQGYGSDDRTIVSEKNVWGAVENVSLSFQTNAEQSGLSPSLFVHLWRHEFESDGYTHCIVGGTEYRHTLHCRRYGIPHQHDGDEHERTVRQTDADERVTK